MMPKRRQQTTEGRLRQIEMQAKAMRLDNRGLRRQPRVAITADDASTTYPRSGTVFPIKFIDGYFDQSAGGTVTLEERHNDVQAWVHNVAKVWLSPDLVVEAFQDRGLGDKGDGDLFVDLRPSYWVIIGTSGITAKDGDELGSGTATVQTFDANDDVVELLDGQGNSIEITVYNASTSEIAGDTLVRVDPEAKTGRLVVDVTGEAPDDRIKLYADFNRFGEVSSSEGIPPYSVVALRGNSYGSPAIGGMLNDSDGIRWHICGPVRDAGFADFGGFIGKGASGPRNKSKSGSEFYPEDYEYFLTDSHIPRSEPKGYGFTSIERPRLVRIAKPQESLEIQPGTVVGPIPVTTREAFSVWVGAPGFRVISGPYNYEDYDGQPRKAYAVVRDKQAPFWGVANMNWLKYYRTAGEANIGWHAVECYLCAQEPDWLDNDLPGGIFTDGLADPESNFSWIYNGSQPEYPKVRFIVELKTPSDSLHPNIEAGMPLLCVRTLNQWDTNFQQPIHTLTPYTDAAIGTVRMHTGVLLPTPDFGEAAPRGWAFCDGEANSSANGGSGIDMRDKFLRWRVDDDPRQYVSDHSEGTTPEYDTIPEQFIRLIERLDNSHDPDRRP